MKHQVIHTMMMFTERNKRKKNRSIQDRDNNEVCVQRALK